MAVISAIFLYVLLLIPTSPRSTLRKDEHCCSAVMIMVLYLGTLLCYCNLVCGHEGFHPASLARNVSNFLPDISTTQRSVLFSQ
ncbi:hypothetical protein C8Q75DRAFT_370821 [Abortiporus biennis]|nr:hypothetical protein C8Q75DRAFT_370821 [Abortiporus biennis]